MEFGTFFSVGKLSLRKSENGLYEIVGEDFVNHFLIISSLPGNSKHLTKSPSFMLHFGGGGGKFTTKSRSQFHKKTYV